MTRLEIPEGQNFQNGISKVECSGWKFWDKSFHIFVTHVISKIFGLQRTLIFQSADLTLRVKVLRIEMSVSHLLIDPDRGAAGRNLNRASLTSRFVSPSEFPIASKSVGQPAGWLVGAGRLAAKCIASIARECPSWCPGASASSFRLSNFRDATRRAEPRMSRATAFAFGARGLRRALANKNDIVTLRSGGAAYAAGDGKTSGQEGEWCDSGGRGGVC